MVSIFRNNNSRNSVSSNAGGRASVVSNANDIGSPRITANTSANNKDNPNSTGPGRRSRLFSALNLGWGTNNHRLDTDPHRPNILSSDIEIPDDLTANISEKISPII